MNVLSLLYALLQKRKAMRSSATAQRRIKSNGVNDPQTISLAVDKFQRAGPERAWPGDSDIRQRRLDDTGVQPVPRYLPGYATDVSHLIV